MSQLKNTYDEIIFLLTQQPKDLVIKGIILVHAINVSEGLRHNGLREDDEDKDWAGIAEGWDQSENGVYSLRYVNKSKEQIQFKFVTQPESSLLHIHAIKLNDDTNLYSFQVDLLKMDSNAINSAFIQEYKKKFLQQLLKEKVQELKLQQPNRMQTEPTNQPKGMFWDRPRNDILQQQPIYGRQDLDPFYNIGGPLGVGGVQGGNMMGPSFFNQFQQQQQPQPGGIRPPQVPPGARFDPFGPEPGVNPFNMKDDRRFGGGKGGFGGPGFI